jgi:excisionase family DNA binding protein
MTRPPAAQTAAPNPSLWHSVPEAAERLGIHEKTAYRLIAEGTFPVPAYLIGKITRVKRADVDAFLKESDAD